MNSQPQINPFESNDPFSDINNQITSCNLSCSSTLSNLESPSLLNLIPLTTTRRVIHSSFIELKKSLGLTEFQRKTQIDSLLKKCKSKAFKSIHEGIKNCFVIKIPRLPQEFITNIKIDFNKKYLSKTILEIYQENNILSSFDEMNAKEQIKENKKGALEEFLSLTLNNVFNYYTHSQQFITDYNHIIQREGEKFALLFYFISNAFIMYYTQTKGNRPKGLRGKQSEVAVSVTKCEKELQESESRDIFMIEKREKENEGEKREDGDSLAFNHQKNNSDLRRYYSIGKEQFVPVSIIANEELV